MRRIKVILAVVALVVATMVVLAAPAIADVSFSSGGNGVSQSFEIEHISSGGSGGGGSTGSVASEQGVLLVDADVRGIDLGGSSLSIG